jgi:hypothetical protein
MALFYGIGYTEGKTVRIDVPAHLNTRQLATQEVEAVCKHSGLQFGGVYFDKTTQKQGNTLTKFAAYRKRNNGKNPPEYFTAL